MDKKLFEKKKSLYTLSKQLVNYTVQLEKIFKDSSIQPENNEQFFSFVKKETEDMFKDLETWERLLQYFQAQGNTIIFQPMLESAIDNMKALIMHSYYKDVRRRRYMEIKRSCVYTFRFVLEKIENEYG